MSWTMAFGGPRRRGFDAVAHGWTRSMKRAARAGLERGARRRRGDPRRGRKRARRGRGGGARAGGRSLLQRRARQRADRRRPGRTRRGDHGRRATARAGAVPGMRTTRAPISLARRLMEHGPHVFLIGEGADEFAARAGLEQVAERLVRDCPSAGASSTKLLAAGGHSTPTSNMARSARSRSTSTAMSPPRPRPAG